MTHLHGGQWFASYCIALLREKISGKTAVKQRHALQKLGDRAIGEMGDG